MATPQTFHHHRHHHHHRRRQVIPHSQRRVYGDDDSFGASAKCAKQTTLSPKSKVFDWPLNRNFDHEIVSFFTSHAFFITLRRFQMYTYMGTTTERHLPSAIYQSRDGGKTFETLLDQDQNVSILRIHISHDGENILMPFSTGSDDKGGLFVSQDGWKTHHRVPSVDSKYFLDAQFNVQDSDRILAMSNDFTLYHSTNKGQDWSAIVTDVWDYSWGDHTDNDVELESTLYYTQYVKESHKVDRGYFGMFRMDDYKDGVQIANQTQWFQSQGNFLFAYNGTSDSNTKMGISSDGGKSFVEVHLQKVNENQVEPSISATMKFTVLNADSDGQVLMIVEDLAATHVIRTGIIYTGQAKTGHFEPALSGVAFMDLFRINKFQEPEYANLIYKLESCGNHTFVALRVLNGGDRESMISFNSGVHWQRIDVKGVLSNGKNIELSPFVNHNGMIAISNPPFSDSEARHVAFLPLVDDNHQHHTVVTQDGGKTWNTILDNKIYRVVSLDEGSIYVAYDMQNPTNIMYYSIENGRPGTWHMEQFADEPQPVHQVITERGNRKMIIAFLTADVPGKNITMTSHIVEFTLAPCDADSYVLGERTCMLGKAVQIYHRDRSKCCANGDNKLDLLVQPVPCKCTISDFMCDKGFVMDTTNNECKPEAKTGQVAKCTSDGMVTQGYQKIGGDGCKDGDEGKYAPQKSPQCSGQSSSKMWVPLVAVLASVAAFTMLAGVLIWIRRRSKGRATYAYSRLSISAHANDEPQGQFDLSGDDVGQDDEETLVPFAD